MSTRSIDPGRRPVAMGAGEETVEAVYDRNPQLNRLLSTEFRSLVVAHRRDGEDLAALLLFRDNEQPFDDQIADGLVALSTVFAEHLVRVIRVHNRHLPFDDDNTDGHEAFL